MRGSEKKSFGVTHERTIQAEVQQPGLNRNRLYVYVYLDGYLSISVYAVSHKKLTVASLVGRGGRTTPGGDTIQGGGADTLNERTV